MSGDTTENRHIGSLGRNCKINRQMNIRLLIQLFSLGMANAAGWYLVFFHANYLFALGILLLLLSTVMLFVLMIRKQKEDLLFIQNATEQQIYKRIKIINIGIILCFIALIGSLGFCCSEYFLKNSIEYELLLPIIGNIYFIIVAFVSKKKLQNKLYRARENE